MHKLKGRKHTQEHNAKIALAHIGIRPSEETKRKMSLIRKGKKLNLTAEARKKISEAAKKTRKKLGGMTPEQMKMGVSTRMKNGSYGKGETHYAWKGGITPINEKIRHSTEYRLWRTSVFARDKYTCIWCEARSKKGNPIILEADHINPFSDYPELRFAIDNGRTLCKPCHRTTDTWGRKSRPLKKHCESYQ